MRLFGSVGNIAGFLSGTALTVGLLLSHRFIPGWTRYYGAGLTLPVLQIVLLITGGLVLLSLSLWAGGKLIKDAVIWKELRVILAAILIAFTANALFVALVDLFALKAGFRALVAVLGVPVIYGNLAAVLGRTSIKEAMLNIFAGALATMGAGFIVAAIIRGW